MAFGKFIISLDFELMWGVRDKRTIESYGTSILGVRTALDLMLESFDKYDIKATFATVGFLFYENKRDLCKNIPDLLPTYSDSNLNPYINLDLFLGENEAKDPYHFGYSLVENIKARKNHEIASHTYSHYYCLEPGQTVVQFEEDLKLAKSVLHKNGIEMKSIVFPRNQYNDDYLNVCEKLGITSYRGNETSAIYRSSNGEGQTLLRRAIRMLDSYINITGYNCHVLEYVKDSSLYNIPSSRFLRPYSSKLFFLEHLKFLRIKNAMTHAAKNNLMYHLWWHPHNFGSNYNENIRLLEKILKHYKVLNQKYGFQSITMQDLSNELKNLE